MGSDIVADSETNAGSVRSEDHRRDNGHERTRQPVKEPYLVYTNIKSLIMTNKGNNGIECREPRWLFLLV